MCSVVIIDLLSLLRQGTPLYSIEKDSLANELPFMWFNEQLEEVVLYSPAHASSFLIAGIVHVVSHSDSGLAF